MGSSSVKFVRIQPQSRGLLARMRLGLLGRLGVGGREGREGLDIEREGLDIEVEGLDMDI